jgi:acyl-coenzyme A thioesterase PaaI-like protein
VTVTHHDLCFGCGVANLFGLQMELEHTGPGEAAGRFFVKQDHQGPPGYAHGGVVASAVDEAMALLVHAEGITALTRRLEVELAAPTPIGTFAVVRARIDERSAGRVVTSAELSEGDDGKVLARARAEFSKLRGGG